jgi:hypothetical protein
MAKAKPAGRSAAKKSSKAKSGTTRRKRKGGGMVEGRPIIVKGGALPGDDQGTLVDTYSVVMESELPADSFWVPPSSHPFQYWYADTVVPEIITISVVVGTEEPVEFKVEGTSWSVTLLTE